MDKQFRNQCDGCRAKWPLVGDTHMKDGKPEMSCQRLKYDAVRELHQKKTEIERR